MRARAITTTAAFLAAVGLAACDGATAPEGAAEVRTEVYGDSEASQESASPTSTSSSSGQAEGEVEFRARVFVQAANGSWSEITNGMTQQKVRVDSSGKGRILASGRVASTGFTRVRVVFEDVRADISAGLQLGTGLLTGEIRVGGSGQTTVEREVHFQARTDASTRLVIELNAQQWLSRADASSRTVSEAEFKSAVAIRTR